jgi:hypothetical protein
VEARVAGVYPSPDLADAYATRLPATATADPEALARFLFAGQPRWIAGLLRVRDFLVAGFGLKTAESLAKPQAGGPPRIGIFRLYATHPDEVVLGEDDRHLDFRVSVLRQDRGPAGIWMVVSTVVECHNALGRAYITLIEPFHRAVVRATLARAAATGWPAQGIS